VSVAYFDTSALLKQYVTEEGSHWVRTYLATLPSYGVFTSCLIEVEMTSAFARRLREHILTADTFETVEQAFDYDVKYKYNLLDVTSTILTEARRLIKRYPLRAYDAVHLATAWLANQKLVMARKSPLTFICADKRLSESAKAEGLPVENPNDYR